MPSLLDLLEASLTHFGFDVQEKSEEARDAEPIFARAIETTLFDKNIDELVILYEARAGFHRRQIDLIRASPR